jgi:UDP-N-acetylmuramate--alanine ligase
LRLGGRLEPIFVDSIVDLPAEIFRAARDGDVVLTMGAGSIGRVAGLLKGGAVD